MKNIEVYKAVFDTIFALKDRVEELETSLTLARRMAVKKYKENKLLQAELIKIKKYCSCEYCKYCGVDDNVCKTCVDNDKFELIE